VGVGNLRAGTAGTGGVTVRRLRVLLDHHEGPVVLAHGEAPGPGVIGAASRIVDDVDGSPVWELAFSVSPDGGRPEVRLMEADPGEVDLAGLAEAPPRVQRPGAYALLLREPGEVLLTRLSGPRGHWTIPGGGVDPGEDPAAAVRREVMEETGLVFEPGPLIDVRSVRFLGYAPDRRLEDFQSFSLIYDGTVDTVTQPQVLEVDGSTVEARWVPWAQLGGLTLTHLAVDVLERWGPAPLPPRS
jgi:8-oxo-dGTP diphosphatase